MDRNRDINARLDGSTGIRPSTDPLPGPSGTFNAYPTGPQTTLHATHLNALTEEMRNMVLAVGETPAVNNVHQLARAFEQSQGPGINTMQIIRGVAIADIIIANGEWSRTGRVVTMQLQLSWLNTSALIEGNELLIEIPWEVQAGQRVNGLVLPSGDLRADGGNAYYSLVEKPEAPNSRSVRLEWVASNLSGAAGMPVSIGGVLADGVGNARTVRIMLTYWTNGNWNPAWPRVEWDVVGDQDNGASLDFFYYGAQLGDLVSVRDQSDVEVQSIAVGALPSDSETTAPLALGQYTLLHRGYRSQPITVGTAI
jgi:hypothetical protein